MATAFALMLSAMLAGCLDSSGETLSVEVTYESTSATIVERWVDGELVEAMYPVLMFDFNRSVTTGEFIQFSVIGEHAVGSTPASESTVVQVEFRKHGLQETDLCCGCFRRKPFGVGRGVADSDGPNRKAN